MTRLANHPQRTRAAAFMLALIGCACVWALAAMALMSSIQPTPPLLNL
jgi:hypothetical protein